ILWLCPGSDDPFDWNPLTRKFGAFGFVACQSRSSSSAAHDWIRRLESQPFDLIPRRAPGVERQPFDEKSFPGRRHMMSSTVTQTTRLVAATMHRLVLSFGRILRWTAWAIVPVVFGGSAPAWASEPSIVFDNTQNSNGGLGFTALPYGAEVTLAGTNRVVNEIDLGVSRQGSPGTADFEVSFYANNGVDGQPGTLLWD